MVLCLKDASNKMSSSNSSNKASDKSSENEVTACNLTEQDGIEYMSERAKQGRLPIGRIIQGQNKNYTIIEQLGIGGFGEVYKVEADTKNSQQQRLFAFKSEYHNRERGRMNCEIAVFNSLKRLKNSKRTHFCQLYDNGNNNIFNWIVITLTGPSLEFISRRTLCQQFSSSTILQIALQSLEAIRDLHNVGFLHRDIKPQNFSVGLPPDEKTIILLDFGICRRFMDSNGVLRPPRDKVKFVGTVRYASRACHLNKEQHRQDDFEQWIYMIYELFNPSNLSWRTFKDVPDILHAKKDFFIRRGSNSRRCPEEFKMIIEYIDKLKSSDLIDHSFISTYIKLAAKNNKINLTAQLDWIDVIRNPKKSKQSKIEKKKKDDVVRSKPARLRDKSPSDTSSSRNSPRYVVLRKKSTKIKDEVKESKLMKNKRKSRVSA